MLASNLDIVEWLRSAESGFENKPQMFYLDIDGESDVTYNGPITVQAIDIPPFSAEPFGLAGREDNIIAEVLHSFNKTFADTSVRFTNTAPASSGRFSVIYVGGDDTRFSNRGSFLGLAEKVDVANRDPEDKAFFFGDVTAASGGFPDVDEAVRSLTETIVHESAHFLGWSHAEHDGAAPLRHVASLSAPTLTSPANNATGQSKTHVTRRNG